MKTTFAELGIPFPLYEAPVSADDDSDYAGMGTCSICETKGHCFHLGIGTHLILPCPACHVLNGLEVHAMRDGKCRECGAEIPFPLHVAAKIEPKTCYQCLRAGKAAITQDTEFGMISCREAFAGVTGGVPGLRQHQFESVILSDNGEHSWIGVRLPAEIMQELVRTPTYGTWQGECWQFCCRYPMTFVGEWHQEDFDARAADGDGKRLYYSVDGVPPDSWNELGTGLAVYLFRCKRCSTLKAHCDSD